MADREVKVTLTGSETVSDAAKKAEGGLSGLGGKLGGLVKGFLAAGAAIAAGQFLKSAIDEAAQAELQIARLGNAVENAGGNFATMRPEIEATVAKVMTLSTASGGELREALTRLITVSGDTKGSLQNLSLVTDLAAFKQIDLTTAAQSVAKAMNGNTTEMNKLGVAGKDATTVLNNARAAFGGFAETEAKTFSGGLEQLNNRWADFKESVGTAILSGGEAGGMMTGLSGILTNLAGFVEENEDAIRTYVSALFGAVEAVVDVGKAIWDVLGPALTWLIKVGFVGTIGGLNTAALGARMLGAAFQQMAGVALQAVGALVEKGGKLLKVFGIDVVQEAGTSLKKFGEDLVQNGRESAEKATATYGESMSRLGNLIKGKESEHTEAVRKGATTRTNLVRDTNKEQEDSHAALAIARNKSIRETDELFQKTADALKKINLTEHKEQWEEIDRNVRLVKGDLSDLLPPVEDLRVEIEQNNEALKDNAETAKGTRRTFQDTVSDAADLGRALLDVGQASGIVSAEMGSVLNSVMNIGTSLAKIGIDPLGGMIGVISGLANVISGLGNNEAHRRYMAALAANRQSLDRLTKEVGNFNLGATGRTFQGVSTAIDATNAANAAGQFGTGPQADIKAFDFFVRQLVKNGVSLDDAKKLLGDLGFGFSNVKEFRGSLGTFSQGLGQVEFGQFGDDFDSQFEAIQAGWSIDGITDDALKVPGLSELGSKFSPALAAALASPDPRAALKALFKKLQTGGLTPADFGSLTPRQFLDFIQFILPMLPETGGPFPGSETGGLDVGSVDVGSVPVPTGGEVVGVGATSSIGSGSGSVGAVYVTGNTFEFGPVTVAPDGKSTEETGKDLAGYVAEQLARRLRDQAAAAGVPI